jgi:hypothetical protein
MSSFAGRWLALREPYDARARNTTVLEGVRAFAMDRPAVAVTDLASGTGSTLRAISTVLPRRQNWRLVDNDLGLLARAATSQVPPDVHVTPIPIDLARDLEMALDGPVDLVTASGLLDLVSHEWLERLVIETAARNLPVYAALTYDGAVSFDPGDPFDDAIIAALNQHQKRDKGFGAALGPSAVAHAIGRFELVGYRTTQGRSDWILSPRDSEIQIELTAGWMAAACETEMVRRDEAMRWLADRRRIIAEGRSSIRVGHVDFFAWPISTR